MWLLPHTPRLHNTLHLRNTPRQRNTLLLHNMLRLPHTPRQRNTLLLHNMLRLPHTPRLQNMPHLHNMLRLRNMRLLPYTPRLRNTLRLRNMRLLRPRRSLSQRASNVEAPSVTTEAHGPPWASVLPSQTTLRPFVHMHKALDGFAECWPYFLLRAKRTIPLNGILKMVMVPAMIRDIRPVGSKQLNFTGDLKSRTGSAVQP